MSCLHFSEVVEETKAPGGLGHRKDGWWSVEALLVVSKPSSLPIHPCGSYRPKLSFSSLREGLAVNRRETEALTP